MTSTTLDLDYVRRLGEQVREAIFPRPREDGVPRASLPAQVRHYQPGDGVDEWVLFIPERTVQWVDGLPEEDVPLTRVRVILQDLSFQTDLAFGEDPDLPEQAPVREPLGALLKAVAGVL